TLRARGSPASSARRSARTPDRPYAPRKAARDELGGLFVFRRRYALLRAATRCYAPLRAASDVYALLRAATRCYAPLRAATGCYAPLRAATRRYGLLRAATRRYAPLRAATRCYAPEAADDRGRYVCGQHPIHGVRVRQADRLGVG